MNPYEYRKNSQQAILELKETAPRWQHYTVRFSEAFPARYIENSPLRGEYYRPQGKPGKAPLVILVHGIGDVSATPCRMLARSLVSQGFACFVLYLIFHSSRLPQTLRDRIYNLSTEEWFEGYQVSVVDIRQVVDWAAQQPEIDVSRVAVFGISFGGFVSAIAMGVDERIKAGAFVVAGGNAEKMNQLARNNTYLAKFRRSEAEYRQIQSLYRTYLAEVAEKGYEKVTPPRQAFLTDPLTYASCLTQRPVLMLNARWDKYIPREATLDFWQACGKPPLKWFAAGHASIWAYYPVIRHELARFLKVAFNKESR